MAARWNVLFLYIDQPFSLFFFFVKKDISNLCKINSQLKYYAIWCSELSLNKNWKVFSEKSIPRFFYSTSYLCYVSPFQSRTKKILKSPEQKTRQTKWIDCTEFFFKKIYIPVLKVKFVFYGKILFHKFFFSIWKSDSLCIYKTLTTILITIFYQRMLHNATSFRISSLLVMKLVLPEIVYLGSGKTKFGFWGLFNLPLKTPLLHISGNSGYKPICHKSIHY